MRAPSAFPVERSLEAAARETDLTDSGGGSASSGADFRPVSRGLLSDDVVNEIRRLLATERLRAGDKLPSERDLAQALKVSRSVVRDAVQRLTALGVLELRRGTGTFVRASFGSSERASAASQQPSIHLPHLLEAAAHIEAALAGLAAERAADADRAAIGPAIGASPLDERSAWSLINRAARNSVLAALHMSLSDQIEAFAGHRGARARPDAIGRELHAILSAVFGGDPESARGAAVRHATSRQNAFADCLSGTSQPK